MISRRAFIQGVLAGGVIAAQPAVSWAAAQEDVVLQVKDYLTKIKNFNHVFADDVILSGEELRLLRSVTKRLSKVQSVVGYANFALLDFDQTIKAAARSASVGDFSKAEISFMESVYYRSAKDYGFFGDKVSSNLTDTIPSREVVKISNSGNYLFRGDALNLYNKIRRDVGQSVVLTSGVRGIVKQMYLFFNKAVSSRGNLSKASRSLAPPGHSYHGVGDFDVGKVGYGQRNFSEDFAKTDEFKKLLDLGYVRIRYPEDNPFGVRYEPWHVKVVKI